jgi:hypothetical protein
MSFQIMDLTSGVPILFIDNNGNMGLGSLPANSQSLTVNGTGFTNEFGDIGSGLLGPGSPNGMEGSATATGFTASITISTLQQPTVTASVPTQSITETVVVFLTSSGLQVTYSIY